MPHIERAVELRPYNTFGLQAQAKNFFRLERKEDLHWLLQQDEYRAGPVLWLGGGSNILLTGDYPGLVVRMELKGREIVDHNENQKLLSAAAGENWHELVLYSLAHNLGGLENMALIPGNVGTAPIQNIGAYGVELKDHFYELEAFDLQEKSWRRFRAEECQFGYRHSIFKGAAKGRYLITQVRFALQVPPHNLRLDYGAIRQELGKTGAEPSIKSVAQAVMAIRQSKLPDPAKLGNSGSFFKNPSVSLAQWNELKQSEPEAVGYPLPEGKVKLAAGWLIEKAGWKGFRRGAAGVHQKQALVLVNYGGASGAEIAALSAEIQASVFRKFDVSLEAEVNII